MCLCVIIIATIHGTRILTTTYVGVHVNPYCNGQSCGNGGGDGDGDSGGGGDGDIGSRGDGGWPL